MSEVFHHAEDDHKYEVLKMEHLTQNTINIMNGNSDIQTAIEEEREEQEIHRKTIPYHRPPYNYYTSTYPSTNSVLTKNITEDRLSNSM